MPVHRRLERHLIDAHSTLATDVRRQVEWKAEGIVEREHRLAGERLCARLAQIGERRFEHLHAVLEGLGEALFLGQEHAHDMILLERQLRIGVTHQPRQFRHEPGEERFHLPQLVPVPNRATDDPPQDISAAFVARDHPVDNEECAGADVIGDDVERRRGQILRAGQLRGRRDQVAEQVDLENAMDVLQNRSKALESHAGIDARLRQWGQRALVVAVELHEHKVPDLDVAIAVGVRRPRRTTGYPWAVVVEDLAAWTAGPGVGHLPEIIRCIRRALVVADAHDALARHPDVVRPGVVRFVVGLVDRGPEPVGGQLVDHGQQLPRVSDRLALEIVAERPVAQHLEERGVARGVADVFQIVVLAAGPQTALHVGSAHVAALVGAEEDFLELDHAAVGEKQRRIVARDERGRRHDRVPLRGEVVEKLAADFGYVHRSGQIDFRCARGGAQPAVPSRQR